MERFALGDVLAKEMGARLGVDLPSDLAGVGVLYAAWSEQVPFDSISKALALREGSLPPGGDPAAFCEQWLDNGLGGTCWGHVAALAGVLQAGGIDCRVGLDRFEKPGVVDFHAFVVVEDGGRRFALDVVHGSGAPLAIEAGAVGRHPAYPTGFDPDDGRLTHWFPGLSHGVAEMRSYALLSTDLDAADVRAFCEVSRHYGMRAESLYHRRFGPDAFIDARPTDDGSALRMRRITADGTDERDVTDPDEAVAALGYAPEVRGLAERAGLFTTGPDGRAVFTPRPS